LTINALPLSLIFASDKIGWGDYIVRQEGSCASGLLANWRDDLGGPKTVVCAISDKKPPSELL
jgi:hypothetical protein